MSKETYIYPDSGKTYKFDAIEDLIKAELNKLPDGCQSARSGDTFYNGYHEWVITYGPYRPALSEDEDNSKGPSEWSCAGNKLKNTYMYPYYLCKFCHAVSENFTTKRAR